MIRSFPHTPWINPGGLSKFYFVPVSDISEIPAIVTGTMVRPILLKDGKVWHQGYASQESLNFQENPSKSDHGTVYQQELTGLYPGARSEVNVLFEEMEVSGLRYILVFEDLLGKRRISGLSDGLEFSSAYDSDSARYQFSFGGTTLAKSPLYTYLPLL